MGTVIKRFGWIYLQMPITIVYAYAGAILQINFALIRICNRKQQQQQQKRMDRYRLEMGGRQQTNQIVQLY